MEITGFSISGKSLTVNSHSSGKDIGLPSINSSNNGSLSKPSPASPQQLLLSKRLQGEANINELNIIPLSIQIDEVPEVNSNPMSPNNSFSNNTNSMNNSNDDIVVPIPSPTMINNDITQDFQGLNIIPSSSAINSSITDDLSPEPKPVATVSVGNGSEQQQLSKEQEQQLLQQMQLKMQQQQQQQQQLQLQNQMQMQMPPPQQLIQQQIPMQIPQIQGGRKPKKMTRAKTWSYDVEQNFRYQAAGYRDLDEYLMSHEMPELWPETGFVRVLVNKVSGFFMYFRRERECKDSVVQRIKLYQY